MNPLWLGALTVLCIWTVFDQRTAQAQRNGQVRIAIVADADADKSPFVAKLKAQLVSVVGEDRAVLEVTDAQNSPVKAGALLAQASADPGVRVVIAAGPMASAVVLMQKDFVKPTIATTVLSAELQGIPRTERDTSGVKNLNYLEFLADAPKDLKLLGRLRPFSKVAIIAPVGLSKIVPAFTVYLDKAVRTDGKDYALVEASTVDDILAALPKDIDSVYVLPLLQIVDPAEHKRLYDELARRKLPNVAMFGRVETELGAMASISPSTNFDKLVRRLALNVSKILDGVDAGKLPVTVEAYRDDLVLNMQSLRTAGIYPTWDLLGEATLVDVIALPDGDTLNLRAVVGEALKNNLELSSARVDALTARREVELTRAILLPQLDASTAMTAIDEGRAAASVGAQGRLTWSGKVELSQVIYSEPALANRQIQRMLADATDKGISDKELDIIQRAASAYFNVILASNLVVLQNRNVAVSKNNLDLAHSRVAAGQGNRSDIARWESEMALGKMDLVDAQANLRAARHVVNQLLARPLDAPVKVAELKLTEVLSDFLDIRLTGALQNAGDMRQFARFMATEIQRNAPALAQLDANIKAQKRLVLSRKRRYYAPTVALFGDLSYNIARIKTSDPPPLDPPLDSLISSLGVTGPTWTLGVNVSLPLFEGGARKTEIQKAALGVTKLERERANASLGLELKLRVTMEQTGARFAKILLAQKAAQSAKVSLGIVQDGYSRGAMPIAQLLDVQRATLQADILAANTIYEFLDSYLQVERTLGRYYFLSEAGERDSFVERFKQFKEENP